jgi:Zn-dependent protease with chaperone function
MRRVVLKVILRLGRYAILPVVALACAMVAVWLMAIDRYTIPALATAPIVLSAAPAAIALALGLVLLPSRRDRNPGVDEGAAPGLWVIWKELDRAFTRSGRTLLIDPSFNASIREERRYVGLFKQHVTMTVGLPLLIILDERAIRAVIAHEVAHARLQHASGGTNLFDFIAASENVLYYADPDQTITGRVAQALLHSLLQWLEEEYRTLSRENELCADADAAKQVGRDEMARALVLVEAGSARLADLVFTPLEKELIGAIKAPTPPFQRIFNQLGDIRAPEQLAAAAVVGQRREEDPKSTHPALGQRLANLGFTDIPPIDEVHASAIDQALAREAVRELTARFDGEWRKMADELVRVGR